TTTTDGTGSSDLASFTCLPSILRHSLTTTPLTARVVGDVNGDGLEDLVFADPGFIGGLTNSPSVDSYGRAYLFLGRVNPAGSMILSQLHESHSVFTPADAVWQGFGLGASVAPLGDIGGPPTRL